jgi:predicted homoserine dehydrogenase-like protein
MLLVDGALREREEQNRPIRVGIVGAGFMSQGLTNQIANSMPGMRIAAVSNRYPSHALDVLRYAGFTESRLIDTPSRLDAEIAAGRPAATEDALLIARSDRVDVIVGTTGSVEFGARNYLC